MTTPLPEMSRHEATWHEHLAGLRAAEAARKQGGNPEAIAALASATAGPVEIGGFTLYPASQGTLWTLQRLAREFAMYADLNHLHPSSDPTAPGSRELIELGLATLVFCDARGCWRKLDDGGLPALIVEADELMWTIPLDVQMKLQEHFAHEMNRIQELSPGEEAGAGKPRAASGALRDLPSPPVDMDSPPASGCSPNTGYPSPMPSGTHP